MDLLGEQMEALRSAGIRCPVYLSVQLDQWAARQHPEWVVVEVGGKLNGAAPLEAGWVCLDMSSPYQDYLASQIDEVLRKYKPTDGVFLDMCWDQVSCSRWALDAMKKKGLDPTHPDDRRDYAHGLALQYMERYWRMIQQVLPGKPVNVAFNSRPLGNLAEERQWLKHVEIEALPTGTWGYSYFPTQVRFVRTMGLPYLGMTGRFHKNWGDFGGLKPQAALKYECCQMIAHGAGCSIGDQLHPTGRLDPATYDLIGSVYHYIEKLEPFASGAQVLADVAVLYVCGEYSAAPGNAYEGVMRSLQELGYQFNFVAPDGDWNRYRLVIVPETIRLSHDQRQALAAFVAAGGRLLLESQAALDQFDNVWLGDCGLQGMGASPFQTTYFRPTTPTAALPATDHVLLERGIRLKALGDDVNVLARIVEPFFDRTWEHFCSHAQTPPQPDASPYIAAAVHNNVAVTAVPLFRIYATHGNLPVRALIGSCLDQLLPDRLLKVTGGPSFLETSVTVQAAARRMMVHLLAFCPRRRAKDLDIVEEPSEVSDLRLSLRVNNPPTSVDLQPGGEPLAYRMNGDRVEIEVPKLVGHALVVLEGVDLTEVSP